MKLTPVFVIASASLARVLGLPSLERESASPITGEVVSTGFTDEGLPYTVTQGSRLLTEDEIAKWKSRGEVNTTEHGLAKRTGEGSSGNCNQWYSDKYCYCGGAISNRGDSYWGSQDHCAIHAVDKGGNGIYGHSNSHTIKWLPTVKIEYKITNYCDAKYDVTMGMCGDPFLDLIDWCQWTWMTAKGGVSKIDDCIEYSFDVNAR